MIEDPTDSPDNSTAVAPRLTERQRRWVEEYLADPNGTLAALRAGYAPISAKQQGTENLANPVLRQILDQERQARAIRMRVEADRVVEELMYVGLSDIRDVVTWDVEGKPTFCPAEDLSPGMARAISAIHFTEKTSSLDGQTLATTREIMFRFHDKKGALDSLMKHLGLFHKPKPAGEDEPPGSGPGPEATQEYDWGKLNNDEWNELTAIKASLKILLAKAEVPVVLEGEAQHGVTS